MNHARGQLALEPAVTGKVVDERRQGVAVVLDACKALRLLGCQLLRLFLSHK